jgi:uncharacterized protein (DUF3084 family)
MRTTTQCRETVRTQCVATRFEEGATATGFGTLVLTALVLRALVFATLATLATVTEESGIMVSTAATLRGGELSVAGSAARATAVSLSSGAVATAGRFVTVRERPAFWDAPFRSNNNATITAPIAAPAPYQIRGAIGGRSGFVPHHRHDPTFSG